MYVAYAVPAAIRVLILAIAMNPAASRTTVAGSGTVFSSDVISGAP